jgi:phosphatidylserine/phosphatidylglycerophosphate/cardiolipin synthase-like enzyme
LRAASTDRLARSQTSWFCAIECSPIQLVVAVFLRGARDMSNRGVKGRVIDESGAPIKELTVKAAHFDSVFAEEDILATGKTDDAGKFELKYSPDDYRIWISNRNPDITVQVFTAEGRLLWETEKEKNVTAEILELPDIKIHRNHLDGWLVTHATLNPERGEPIALFPGNEIHHLVDGDTVFPEVTRAAKEANTSIRLMNLAFAVDSSLITEFKSDFDPLKLPPANCKSVMEATLEQVLLEKSPDIPINILVANIPLSAADTVSEVRKFFNKPNIKTSDFHKGFNILHARAVICDGFTAFVMGSSFKQSYFNDARHAIYDARHSGTLQHDVSLKIAGPAVAHIDKTLATFWKATTDEPLVKFQPVITAKPEADNVASVQVLRTLPGAIFKAKEAGDEDLPHGETGILEAYQRAIHNAERFIYFENQYFTSPEIVDALIHRLKDTAKSKLQLIFVLNHRPDLPGYPGKQIDIINRLKIAVEEHGHQMGVYTLWSRDEKQFAGSEIKFEVMPIYVHSKVAIIDDKWATMGTANLDGTSMNYHQVGLLVGGYFGDKFLEMVTLVQHDFLKFAGNVIWFLFYFFFKQLTAFPYIISLKCLLMLLYALYLVIKNFWDYLEIITEITDIPKILDSIRVPSSQHALPHRAFQPGRNLELNVVIYNGIAGQPKNDVIRQLRERLWQEHLGLASLPAELQNVPENPTQMTWVEFWNERAKAYQEAIKKDQKLPNDERIKIVEWMPQSDAELYLQDLEISRSKLKKYPFKYNFKDCKIDQETLFPWPII